MPVSGGETLKKKKKQNLQKLPEKMGYNACIKIIADISRGRHLPSSHHLIASVEFPCHQVVLLEHPVAYLNLPIRHLENKNC